MNTSINFILKKEFNKNLNSENVHILDPFAGTGTTCKVALDLGRKAIGYEINEEYLPLIDRKI